MSETWPLSRCESDRCRAEIIWAISEHGGPVLVDAQPSPNGNIRLDDRGMPRPVAVHLGRSHVPQPTLDGDDPPPLYVSHFATCPDAERFRKRGRR